MYLSQLEVVGFKSFAQKTKFKFNQGMSAIVGPNGCGKTNVVDAIRWVLGEQKSTVLRSEVMDNVIFNGTQDRKPLGMAEATIVIQNNKGILPSDYSEVTVTRRIFRDGESEYLINNTKCRLRDILDLFMDTGLGSDSYSVIELKMVEAILSGRPEERRHLIEEAAGVNKFKLRRKEATRKLQNIQGDLLRVKDIVAEIEKLVNSLGRQASKTKRYNKLLERHKELELAILVVDFRAQQSAGEQLQREIATVVQKKLEQEKELAETEEQLQKLAVTLNDTDLEYQHARDTESIINKDIAQKIKDIAVEHEKYNAVEKEQERIGRDITETEVRSMTADENIATAENRLKECSVEKEQNDVTTEILRKERNSVADELKETRQDANFANEDVMGLQTTLNGLKTTILKNQNKKINLESLIERSYAEIDKVRDEIDTLTTQKSEAESQRPQLLEAQKNAENVLNTTTEKQNLLKIALDDFRNSISEKKNELNAKRASLNFLNSLVDVDDSAKYLLNSNNWKPAEKLLLIEAVGADEKFRVAIEAALGSTAYSFLVDTPEIAEEAIAGLQINHKGKVGFICRNRIPSLPRPTATTDNIPNTYGIISEFVRVDDDIRNFLRNLLSDTVLVEDFATAQRVVSENKFSVAVTLKGEIVRSSGYIRGGSVLNKEGQTVGKHERILAISSEIEALNAAILTLEEKQKQTKAELDEIDLRVLTSALKQSETALVKNDQFIQQISYKSDALTNNIKAYETNTARYEEELQGMNSEEESIGEEIDELEGKLNIAKEELNAIKAKLNQNETALRKKEEELKLAEMNRIKINAQISAANAEIARNKSDVQNTSGKIENLKNELQANTKRLALISDTISAAELELNNLNIKFDDAKSQREILAEKKENLDEQITLYSNDLSLKRKNNERVTELQHQLEIKISGINGTLQNLSERATENFNIDLANPDLFTIELASIPEAKEELAELKNKLSQLGNVNFMALEEFETQSKRYSFYQEQLQDLTDSEKTLQETISEINNTAEKKFLQTFDVVNNNFQMLFKKLFNSEAESELQLNGDNILDCDVEIIATPPGKKPHSIEMLSAGEKTLTAIALLFSIYLVKPSPFCILDEVDAPLDDMNIDRFLGMIKEFSENTQFLMVTHNKKTMMAADTLYGITQQEKGVSKIVSVRLSEN